MDETKEKSVVLMVMSGILPFSLFSRGIWEINQPLSVHHRGIQLSGISGEDVCLRGTTGNTNLPDANGTSFTMVFRSVRVALGRAV